MERKGSVRAEMSDQCFDQLRQFILEKTGIVLSDSKKEMLFTRLYKLIESGQVSDFDTLCEGIQQGKQVYEAFAINAATTNMTAFYRERYHFEYLADSLLPKLLNELGTSKRLRIWSAGCSSGEEAYSIAMTLLEFAPELAHWDLKILGTDIAIDRLEQAKVGIYRKSDLAPLTDAQRKRWFQQGQGENQEKVKVKTELSEKVTFNYLNLFEPWPMTGQFDVIFCRNVSIYFGKESQVSLFRRFADALKPGGYLFIGHSENLYDVSEQFKSLGQTIYHLGGEKEE